MNVKKVNNDDETMFWVTWWGIQTKGILIKPNASKSKNSEHRLNLKVRAIIF